MSKDTLVRFSDPELVEWLEVEADSRRRSRTWLIEEICRMYRNQLEKRRQRAAEGKRLR